MEKILVNIVIEILGRPAEHVKEALNTMIVKLKTEKGTRVIETKNHEPVPVEKSNGLFTSFSEISLEFDSLSHFLGVIFAYMPAHIEMISPERVTLTNTDMNEVVNRIVLRLHDYDAITKKAMYEQQILIKKLQEVAPHLFQQPVAPTVNQQKKEVKQKKKSSKKIRSK